MNAFMFHTSKWMLSIVNLNYIKLLPSDFLIHKPSGYIVWLDTKVDCIEK